MKRLLETGPLTRSMPLERATVDQESRTVELAFSSEAPVERWFGVEILDHGPGSVRLDRLQGGGPLLVGHDDREHVGVVEQVRIDADRVARARVRFGNSQRAQEIFQDVVDGIRRHVSVGYRIHRMVLEGADDGVETYRAVDWEPYEISLVAVPADPSVGVGRHLKPTFRTIVEDKTMSSEPENTPIDTQEPNVQETPPVDVRVLEDQVRQKELQRIRDLKNIGERYARWGGQDLAEQAIVEGWDVARLREAILERLPSLEQAGTGGEPPASRIGLSDQEARRYSLLNAIRAAATGDWKGAEYELECSRRIAEQLDREPHGFFVPWEVQSRMLEQRVMTATTGADLIATEHLADSFIENLRPNSVVLRLGATVLDGLRGNIDIPKQLGSAAFYWLADDQDVTDSDLTLGTVSLTPKTVAGSVPMSRRLLKQSSPAIEDLVRRDLARGAALAIDIAALEGDGTANRPVGVVNQVGVNTQTIADVGGIPTWDELVGFETALASDDALTGRLAYVTTAAIYGALKTKPKDAGSGLFLLENDQANGYPVVVSNQLSAGRIIFGNWEDVLVGMWGVLDVMPDTAAKAASGGLVLRVFQDVDVAVRHPESFCINA